MKHVRKKSSYTHLNNITSLKIQSYKLFQTKCEQLIQKLEDFTKSNLSLFKLLKFKVFKLYDIQNFNCKSSQTTQASTFQ